MAHLENIILNRCGTHLTKEMKYSFYLHLPSCHNACCAIEAKMPQIKCLSFFNQKSAATKQQQKRMYFNRTNL